MSWYRMHRGWQDHEVFSDEPYTEREAWEWLISEASWDGQRQFNILGSPAILPRGHLSFSLSFLAKAWGWNKSKVDRILKRYAEWGLIETQNERGQVVVSICEYDKYQGSENENETPNERKQDADRNANETNNKNLRNKEYILLYARGISENVILDFLKHRKAKKSPVTETVITQIEKEAAKVGWGLEDALRECCARGWQGFKAEWVNKENSHETNNRNNQKPYSKSDHVKQILADAVQESLRRDGQESLGGSCIPIL